MTGWLEGRPARPRNAFCLLAERITYFGTQCTYTNANFSSRCKAASWHLATMDTAASLPATWPFTVTLPTSHIWHSRLPCYYSFTDVSRKVTFPERRFPERRFPEKRFPESCFPDKTFPGQSLSRKDVSRKKICVWILVGKTKEGFFSVLTYYKAKR